MRIMADDDGTDATAAAATAAAPTVRVAGLVGVVAPFNGKEEWNDYVEQCFVANDVRPYKITYLILIPAHSNFYRPTQ